ncbi:MAG: hypothetical protein WKG06_07685 [Segetibacter sp.]
MSEENGSRPKWSVLVENYLSKRIKAAVDYLPLASAFLIFLGYWNLSFYYERFDISIYNYISITEILTSFLPIIKQTFQYTLGFVAVITIIFLTSSPTSQNTQAEKVEFKKNEFDLKFNLRSLVSKETYITKKFSSKLWWLMHHIYNILLIFGTAVAGICFVYITVASLSHQAIHLLFHYHS